MPSSTYSLTHTHIHTHLQWAIPWLHCVPTLTSHTCVFSFSLTHTHPHTHTHTHTHTGTLGQGGVVMSEDYPRVTKRQLWSGMPPSTSVSPGLRQRSGFAGELTRSQASAVGGTLSPRRFGVGPKMFSMFTYEVATISRLLKIIGLFCKRAL